MTDNPQTPDLTITPSSGTSGASPASGPTNEEGQQTVRGTVCPTNERAATIRISRQTKDDKKRIKDLERDLARKEKALAETAALIILRKKAKAIRGRAGEDE